MSLFRHFPAIVTVNGAKRRVRASHSSTFFAMQAEEMQALCRQQFNGEFI